MVIHICVEKKELHQTICLTGGQYIETPVVLAWDYNVAARTLLREKLALNSIHYEDSDTILELIARWANTNDDLIIEYIRPNSCFSANTVDFGAKITIYDSNDNELPVSGVPVTIDINGNVSTVLTGNDGVASQ